MGFYVRVLKFEFDSKVVRTIKTCIESVILLVMVNGFPRCLFGSGRGIRHRDPLSPYLFIVLVEVLGMNLLKLIQKGNI